MGSALVMSIYSFVDTIAVGQSVGPMGTAAMAAINPLYSVLAFLSILCGIGGSVLMGNAKGRGQEEKGNAYFTSSLLLIGSILLIGWSCFLLFQEQILTFFGATPDTMPYVLEYAKWIIRAFPFFIAPTFLGAFLRNDGAPGLAMGAVIAGGLFNMFGDWYLCFPLDMGMEGAAIATVTGSVIQTLMMCTHFLRRKCCLRLVRPHQPFVAIRKILTIGFGASILDLGNVILPIILNNQIMRYGGVASLSVYGVVGTISILFQALFCGVGQAIQPLVSSNYGAKQPQRIQLVLRMSLLTVIILGGLFTLLGELFPSHITRLFIAATPEVLDAAPSIFRTYFLLFPFLGINVLSTYYLQSVMQGRMSMTIAALRSILLSSLLLFSLPTILKLTGVLIALPISELMVTFLSLWYIRRSQREDS